MKQTAGIRALVLAMGAFVVTSHAETLLGGELSQATFDRSGNPYVIEQDMIIPKGQEVVIREGCVFLFKAFTGVRVSGKLVVEGTTENPVIFTSMYDKDFNDESTQLANPFDWNGIFITADSDGAVMRNFQLRYSVYGVKSQNDEIIIQNARFRQNGQLHFTVDEKIQYVQDDIPFSYGSRQLNSEPGESEEASKKKEKKQVSPRRKLRIAALSTGIVGAALGATFGILAGSSYSDWNAASEAGNRDLYSEKQSEFNARLAGGIAFGALGVLGLTGFGLTFAF